MVKDNKVMWNHYKTYANTLDLGILFVLTPQVQQSHYKVQSDISEKNLMLEYLENSTMYGK
jgi:hypothetical protein